MMLAVDSQWFYPIPVLVTVESEIRQGKLSYSIPQKAHRPAKETVETP